MQSPRTSHPDNLVSKPAGRGLALSLSNGFTLIEILVVLAIVASVLGLGLFMSMDVYRGFSFRSERDVVVSVLQKARSRAINNYHQTSWGVCYVTPNYIMFRGTICTSGASTNETIPAGGGVVVTGLSAPGGVVFSQLAGNTTATIITITQNGKISTTTVNYEGTIIW